MRQLYDPASAPGAPAPPPGISNWPSARIASGSRASRLSEPALPGERGAAIRLRSAALATCRQLSALVRRRCRGDRPAAARSWGRRIRLRAERGSTSRCATESVSTFSPSARLTAVCYQPCLTRAMPNQVQPAIDLSEWDLARTAVNAPPPSRRPTAAARPHRSLLRPCRLCRLGRPAGLFQGAARRVRRSLIVAHRIVWSLVALAFLVTVAEGWATVRAAVAQPQALVRSHSPRR